MEKVSPMHKKFSPAAERNRDYIAKALTPYMAGVNNLLEVASGSGQHASHLAKEFEHVNVYPTDLELENIDSIKCYLQDCGLSNFQPPTLLDASDKIWPLDNIQILDAIFCSNMIHISPLKALVGLIEGAERYLKTCGLLFLYGPFIEPNVETTQSNIDFDLSLRARNPEWGLRNTEQILEIANRCNLKLTKRIEMPANNLILVFRKH